MVSSSPDFFKRHSEICNRLKLDSRHSRVLNESWGDFQTISKNYTLEGEPLSWLCCAIYTACWKAATLTPGYIPSQSSCADLTSLLKACNLSIAQFFCNIRKWSDMMEMPHDFNRKIDHVENCFAVVCNAFKEFQQTFVKIFKAPEWLSDQEQQKRSRKQKNVPCTSLKVMEFCWTLFASMKADQPKYGNDLVSSCHLLVVVCDWAFNNALLSNRKDLLNPEFRGLPKNWQQEASDEQEHCIIGYLCSTPQMVTDVKYIKQYPFRHFVQGLFDKNVLLGKDDGFTDALDSSVFEKNYKSIADLYESKFLAKGDFNETIFLADYRRKLIAEKERNPILHFQEGECTAEFPMESPQKVNQTCLTPLTGRRYLGPKDVHESHTALEKIARLNTLLNGRQAAPGEALVQLFKSCARDPTEKVLAIVSNLETRFRERYTVSAYMAKRANEHRATLTHLTKTLFYKLIESILQNEKTIHPDISAIVEKDVFYECVYACSMEIVIYAYETAAPFPWILDALKIQAYNFVKVIELIIRLKDQFSRDTIRHLNMIEEMIISSLVWKSDGIIWEAIKNSRQEIPKFEDTALPGHINAEQNAATNNGSDAKKFISTDIKPVQSPGPSAMESFQSPVRSGQSLLMINYQNMMKIIPLNDPQKPLQPPAPDNLTTTTTTTATPTNNNRPKRTGGLSIIFRKFYHLAGVRLEDLLSKLDIVNVEVKRKIWTIFEESVRKEDCELMKDRDLDQLLMCAIYMVGKLSNIADNNYFTEIMKEYRKQPQAKSEVYRNVMLQCGRTERLPSGEIVEHPEKTGDLIEFYNTVLVGKMKKFAEKFVDKGNRQSHINILLSPLPCTNKHLVSPARQYNNISIKAYETPIMGLGGGKTYSYFFSRSPSKDLRDINKAIKSNGVTGKRLLVEDDLDMHNSKRIANRKVHTLIEERRSQNSE